MNLSTGVNSSPPNDAYMRQWLGSALHGLDNGLSLYSAPSHYLNQCWVIVNWTLRNKLQWNFNQNTNLSIHENASEYIVWEMTAILSRGRLVNTITSAKQNTTAPWVYCNSYILCIPLTMNGFIIERYGSKNYAKPCFGLYFHACNTPGTFTWVI